MPRRYFLQLRQPQLRTQLLGAAVYQVHNTITVNALELRTKRLKQMPQLRITLQRHALHFEQLLGRNPGLDRIARRQTLADRKHHGIGQRCLIRSLSAALLLLIRIPAEEGALAAYREAGPPSPLRRP